MRRDAVTQAVPHADPDFLRTMERLPDPPPGAFENVMRALPKLHELFLRKRKAAAENDVTAFDRVVDEEVRLIEEAEQRDA